LTETSAVPSGRRRPHRQDVHGHEPHQGSDQPVRSTAGADGFVSWVPPRQPRPVIAGHFRCDLAPELPAPTTRTPPSRSCDGFRYSLECISPARPRARARARTAERGGLRSAPTATHHVVGLEPMVAGRHHETVTQLGEPVHPDAVSNGKVEPGRVGQQVFGHGSLVGNEDAGAGTAYRAAHRGVRR
jgi:hypothetical protein